MTCASLDPRSRFYRVFGARGCNGRGTFGRWKYDLETEWRTIPCPACARASAGDAGAAEETPK